MADPGGATYLQPAELFDPEERGGIALPGMLIISPDGEEIYRYQGRDFADRTNDDDLWEALAGLDLPAIEPEAWPDNIDVPDDLRGFFRPTDLGAYFRGNKFGALAIAGRLGDDATARAIAHEHRVMADATLGAWDALRGKG
ncbi:MAG: hypothetical protein AAGA37_18355 [Actinomycetota bacterium]